MSEDRQGAQPDNRDAARPDASTLADEVEWERVVAELTAAMQSEQQADPMPAALLERVVGAGELIVREQSATRSTPVVPIGRSAAGSSAASSPLRVVMQWSGWLAAAALAVWVAGSRMAPNTPATPPLDVAAADSATAGMRLREALLGSATDVAQLAWTATADSAAVGAGGDVVWSADRQAGVMRIAGLRPNDRKRWQYQLWIFDKRRDQRYPVDGGVFDIPAGGGEVFVPINARVPVGEAVMFAITVEPAGGVVVSTRERIALLAKAGG